MDRLVALLGFGFVCTVTPGPNNILLWASGASFGLRRSWPHVMGTALGVGLMAVLVAAGLGVLVTTVPPLAFAMKVAGSSTCSSSPGRWPGRARSKGPHRHAR
jgi:threonine/homoserine/homoserine lactone efflux protein